MHLVFDVNMYLTHKARLVEDGHYTSNTEGSTYTGVVSRETFIISLTYTTLVGLDKMAAELYNSYTTVSDMDKFYIICVPEFGSESIENKSIVKRALHEKISRIILYKSSLLFYGSFIIQFL